MRSYLDRTGWTFHVAAGFIALPEPKRAKLWRYIDKLLASHRVNRTWRMPLGWPCGSRNCFPIWAFGCNIYIMICILFPVPSQCWPRQLERYSPVLKWPDDLRQTSSRDHATCGWGGTVVSVRHIDSPTDDVQASCISDEGLVAYLIQKDVRLVYILTESCSCIRNGFPIQPHTCCFDRRRCGKDWQQQMHSRPATLAESGESFVPRQVLPIGSRNASIGNILLIWKSILKQTCKNLWQVWKHWHRLQSCGYHVTHTPGTAFQWRFHLSPIIPELSQV